MYFSIDCIFTELRHYDKRIFVSIFTEVEECLPVHVL